MLWFDSNSGSQPVGHDPFGGQTTLSQGSPKTNGKHRYPLQFVTIAKLQFELAIKIISWLGSPQHEELY